MSVISAETDYRDTWLEGNVHLYVKGALDIEAAACAFIKKLLLLKVGFRFIRFSIDSVRLLSCIAVV